MPEIFAFIVKLNLLRYQGEDSSIQLITLGLLIPLVLLGMIIYVLGRYIFGKVCGYKFNSFFISIFSVGLYKGKLKVDIVKDKWFGMDCIMAPPVCDCYHFPYVLYNLGGVIASMFISLILLFNYILIDKGSYLSLFLISIALYFIGLSLLNGIPFKLGNFKNHGYFTYKISKDKEARRLFWLLRNVDYLLLCGESLSDAPDEWFDLPQNPDFNNSSVFKIGTFRCDYLFCKKQYKEMKELSELMLSHATEPPQLYKMSILCNLLYYEIMGLCRKDEIDKLYTEELISYIEEFNTDLEIIRLMYALELFVKHNYDGAKYQLDKFEHIAKDCDYPAIVRNERELITNIAKKAQSVGIVK